ncbi:MAG: hypothetical protein MUC56_16825 [Thermoanaerobaculales bacterium]|jgi:hypothetical protein|nr:hypothetical protein [Thermoanaerobaculales bacterium]
MSDPKAMGLETARRLLALVPHDRRFPVGQFRPPSGVIPGFVRSFAELEFVLMPQQRSLPGLHMERLADWIENDVGDPVGAGEVRDAAAAAGSYVEACMATYERVRDRVASARRVIESEPEARGPERSAR